MRLDHLLSREKAEAEREKPNRRSIGRRKSKDGDRTVWKAIQWRVKMPKSRFHKRSQRFETGTLLRIAKSSVSFSGLIGQKPKGRSPGPELYLDNCTENDFEQRPVGRSKLEHGDMN